MTRAIAWDIETLPTADALAQPYPEADRLPPATYKLPEAIAKWREKDRKEWDEARIKDYSVNPRLGRIAAIGFKEQGGEGWHNVAADDSDEKKMLVNFWDIMQPKSGSLPRWVTFNGSFDIRFVLLRSIKHGVTPSWTGTQIASAMARYRFTTHVDVKSAVLNWETRVKGEDLSAWCAFFGLDKKVAHGSEVYAMAQRGEWDRIGAYAQDDAEKTMAIYERIAPYYL